MKERFNQLDGLKVVMSIWIVLFHYSAMFTHQPNQLPYYNRPHFAEILMYGSYCVEVFFVISGFLIAYSYKDRIKDMTLGQFLKKRMKFLYWSVAFSVVLGILDKYLFAHLLQRENKISFWKVLTSLTLTSTGYVENDLPYGATSWYIGVLIICYILFYFVRKMSKDNYSKYLGLSIVLVLLGAICIYKRYQSPLFYESNGRGYCCFFLGVLLCEVQKLAWLNKKIIAYLGLMVLMVVTAFSYKYGIENTYGKFGLAIAVFVAPMVVFIFLNIGWIKVVFGSWIFRVLGKITTALYLTHTSVMGIIYTLNKYYELGYKSNEPRYMFFNLGMTLLFAVVWYFVLERWLIPIISKMTSKIMIINNENS